MATLRSTAPAAAPTRPKTLLDHAVAASVSAMLAMALVAFAQSNGALPQTLAAATPAVTQTA